MRLLMRQSLRAMVLVIPFGLACGDATGNRLEDPSFEITQTNTVSAAGPAEKTIAAFDDRNPFFGGVVVAAAAAGGQRRATD